MRVVLTVILMILSFTGFSQVFKNPKAFMTFQFSTGLIVESITDDNRQIPDITADFEETRVLEYKLYVHRYIIGRYLAIGAGSSLTYQLHPDISYAQIFGDLRGFLSDEDNTVYPFIQLGTGVPFSSEYNRNVNLGIGLGARFSILERLFSLDLTINGRVFRLRGEGLDLNANKMEVTGIFASFGMQF